MGKKDIKSRRYLTKEDIQVKNKHMEMSNIAGN